MSRDGQKAEISTANATVEIITPQQLAERLQVPASWIYNHTRPCTAEGERIPCLRVGKYVRFRWGSPELMAWLRSLESK